MILMKLVRRAITVTSVLSTALKIVKPVDTQTAFALVRRGGWDTIVPQVKINIIGISMAFNIDSF